MWPGADKKKMRRTGKTARKRNRVRNPTNVGDPTDHKCFEKGKEGIVTCGQRKCPKA